MINMFNLNLFKNIGFLLYLFVYLIFPYSAITQTLKVDFIRNLENSLNAKDLEFIRKNFRNEESQNIPKQFSKIINDFPNSKWKIKRLKSNIPDEDILRIKPLEEVIIAGAIKPHQVNSLFEQEILLEPLASGGIFKITRAPSKPGMQIWSGIIAHPEGMITFTKSIDIVDEI